MSAPRCPRCGSDQIVEWNLVPVPYPVRDIDAGMAEIDPDYLPEDFAPIWDAAEVEEYGCRECVLTSKDSRTFEPGHPFFEDARIAAERRAGRGPA